MWDYDEEYIVTFPNGYGRSILTVPWVEIGGKCTITCAKTGYNATVDFHTKVNINQAKLKLTYTSGILDSYERLGAMIQFLALCDISQTPSHGLHLLKNQIQDGEFFGFCSLFDKEIQNGFALLYSK